MESDYQLDQEPNHTSSSIGFISAKSKIIISISIVAIFLIALLIIILVVSLENEETPAELDHSEFVILTEIIPDIVTELRYYSTYNFVGARIDGYEEPVAILTKKAAEKLKNVSKFMDENGYRIKVWDCYRPKSAVDHFLRWSEDESDDKMKDIFYPHLTKKEVYKKGFVASNSSHSKGSTVDLTLINKTTGADIDFGGCFDYFGNLSHTNYTGIEQIFQDRRQFLKQIMEENDFENLPEEWWHYTLKDQQFPNTYFNFPVNATLIKQGN